MKNFFIFYFAESESQMAHFLDSRLLESFQKDDAVHLTQMREHDLYKPITIPGEYNPEHRVIIALGDHVPFRCHFNFLPPNEETKQMPVYVIDIGSAPERPDYSKIMIGVRSKGYSFDSRRPLRTE